MIWGYPLFQETSIYWSKQFSRTSPAFCFDDAPFVSLFPWSCVSSTSMAIKMGYTWLYPFPDTAIFHMGIFEVMGVNHPRHGRPSKSIGQRDSRTMVTWGSPFWEPSTGFFFNSERGTCLGIFADLTKSGNTGHSGTSGGRRFATAKKGWNPDMANFAGHTWIFVDQIWSFSGHLHKFASEIRGSSLKIPQEVFATSSRSNVQQTSGFTPTPVKTNRCLQRFIPKAGPGSARSFWRSAARQIWATTRQPRAAPPENAWCRGSRWWKKSRGRSPVIWRFPTQWMVLVRENPMNMDDLEVPPWLRKPPYGKSPVIRISWAVISREKKTMVNHEKDLTVFWLDRGFTRNISQDVGATSWCLFLLPKVLGHGTSAVFQDVFERISLSGWATSSRWVGDAGKVHDGDVHQDNLGDSTEDTWGFRSSVEICLPTSPPLYGLSFHMEGCLGWPIWLLAKTSHLSSVQNTSCYKVVVHQLQVALWTLRTMDISTLNHS